MLPVNQHNKKFIQQVTGTFLYYTCTINNTMLTVLSVIAADQAAPTQQALKNMKQFFDFSAIQEEISVTYKTSDMILAINSDTSDLSEPKAWSQAGGHFFLSSKKKNLCN